MKRTFVGLVVIALGAARCRCGNAGSRDEQASCR
jgi:hypothetical protein